MFVAPSLFFRRNVFSSPKKESSFVEGQDPEWMFFGLRSGADEINLFSVPEEKTAAKSPPPLSIKL